MIRSSRLLLVSIALAGSGLSAATAFANQGQCEHGHFDSAKMAAWHQKRQNELHAKLKLSAEQEAAWQTYVKRATPMPAAHPDWKDMASLSTPERLARMQEHMKQREADMSDRIAATQAFYATLTPAQQTLFDQSFAPHAHGHGKPEKQADSAPLSLNQAAQPSGA